MKSRLVSQIAEWWDERTREPETSGSFKHLCSPVVSPRLMKSLLAAGAILLFIIPTGRTQSSGVQRASDFTSVEYFDPPHQQQMKSRLSGAEAQPLAGGLLVIHQLRLETFDVSGKPEMIVNAPECVYDTFNRTASSPGHLTAQTGDGKYRVEGDGFLWRQNDSRLTISNNVQTLIEIR